MSRACAEPAISVRTWQRWTEVDAVKVDGRPEAWRPEPANKLSREERQQVLEVCHRPEFASIRAVQRSRHAISARSPHEGHVG